MRKLIKSDGTVLALPRRKVSVRDMKRLCRSYDVVGYQIEPGDHVLIVRADWYRDEGAFSDRKRRANLLATELYKKHRVIGGGIVSNVHGHALIIPATDLPVPMYHNYRGW